MRVTVSFERLATASVMWPRAHPGGIEPASRSAVANLHTVSTRSPYDLRHSPFMSALVFAFARAGGLITSGHSLSGFGSCCAVDRGPRPWLLVHG
jgi:hypothetical protein